MTGQSVAQKLTAECVPIKMLADIYLSADDNCRPLRQVASFGVPDNAVDP